MPATETRLALADFPDSPYADELRRGVSTSGFPAEIEAQYAERHLDRVKARVRLWFSVLLLAALTFSLDQLRSGDTWTIEFVLHLLVAIPAALVMTFIVWTSAYGKWFMKAAAIATPLAQVLVTIVTAKVMSEGQPEALGSLVLNVFAVFFFSGLLFRSAVMTGTAMFIAFALAAYYYQLPAGFAYPSFATIAIGVVLASIVHHGTEIAYRRSFLEGELVQQLAARDGLTGVMNRRAFDEHLRRTWQQAQRDQRELAVVMVDIDYFKAYNDFHGHQAGDSILRQVAQVLAGFARRPLDIAARYGGEEFGLIFYDLGIDKLTLIADQMRQAVADLQIEHGAGGASQYVTISVGAGVVQPAIDRTPEGALQFADEALYQAKEAGRDCVVIRNRDEYRSLKTGAFSSPRTVRIR